MPKIHTKWLALLTFVARMDIWDAESTHKSVYGKSNKLCKYTYIIYIYRYTYTCILVGF